MLAMKLWHLGALAVAVVITATSPVGRDDTARQAPTAASGGSVLWSAGHENGDLDEWDYVSVSGSADASATNAIARSGDYSNAMTVSNDDGGVRMVVVETAASPADQTHPENLPASAYYSVWYYFPEKIEPDADGWGPNIYQWKQAWKTGENSQTRRLLYWIRADWSDSGNGYKLHLRSKLDNATGVWDNVSHSEARSDVPIPLNTWVHLECFYQWSKTGNGTIECWQDDTKIFDLDNVYTEFDWSYVEQPRQWTVNNYSRNTTPSSHTIYVDDAAVSTSRIGSGEGPPPPAGYSCGGLAATIVGTPGDDVIRGTHGDDVIVALGGDDTITGLRGDDHICGGPGRDTVYGNRGADTIRGGAGSDFIWGGPGDDYLSGTSGHDQIYGREGQDHIAGAKGDDKLVGGADDDQLNAGQGEDECVGGPGEDDYRACESID